MNTTNWFLPIDGSKPSIVGRSRPQNDIRTVWVNESVPEGSKPHSFANRLQLWGPCSFKKKELKFLLDGDKKK